MSSLNQTKRLQQAFQQHQTLQASSYWGNTLSKSFEPSGLLEKKHFEQALIGEIIELVLKKATDVTLERWDDLKNIGVLDEVWDACFGEGCEAINFEDYISIFKAGPTEEKSEVEKMVDLCRDDEALRNQVEDLEASLQNEKDLLAGTDILLEEQTTKNQQLAQQLGKAKAEVQCLTQGKDEFDSLRSKIKTMETEHRLLKRDFDLVFATNKSVQKKMEKAELENRTLRKTIVHMASQLEKVEREHKQATPKTNEFPQTENVDPESWSQTPQPLQPQQPHLVWDPSVRALVPITVETVKGHKKKKRQTPQFNNKKKRWNDRDNHNNGRMISPFPRRYTSSHIPRYRRKYEMSELSRVQQNSV